MKIVVATGNEHKKIEIADILGLERFDFATMKEEGILIDIVEDGGTFEENALIKAREVRKHTIHAVLADDSGLEVDALDGAPGIYSARFAGENASDEENNQKLLELMKDVPSDKRSGRFVCVIAFIDEGGREYVFRGECPGKILESQRGEGGFGYDPLFYVESKGKTFAQLDGGEKNSISHRAVALKDAKEIIVKISEEEKR
ncbi:XTP/dITP diphosphatase [Alkalibacter mobilis]|uniref:XTP/dITP diphosphatase n=1 Tax=Alkalibacter mobilis TaxID=2787712 RepID=UPI00189DB4D2|nr:XTP/dITP diphosphatase [Alkalibacter mobilis]MBF7097256.1 XTP/dITP diphosphatase [Alkalibacter mobilis]